MVIGSVILYYQSLANNAFRLIFRASTTFTCIRKLTVARVRELMPGGMHAFRFSIFGCRRRYPSSKLCKWVTMVLV